MPASLLKPGLAALLAAVLRQTKLLSGRRATWDLPVRKLVNAIGLFAAITTAVAMPCGFFIVSYHNASVRLAFKGALNATRVAQYVNTNVGTWQHQRSRLAELIELPDFAQPINHFATQKKQHGFLLSAVTWSQLQGGNFFGLGCKSPARPLAAWS
jgi:hypothetical protein